MGNLEDVDGHFVIVWDFLRVRIHDHARGTRIQDLWSRGRTLHFQTTESTPNGVDTFRIDLKNS